MSMSYQPIFKLASNSTSARPLMLTVRTVPVIPPKRRNSGRVVSTVTYLSVYYFLQLLNMLEDHFGTYLMGRHRLSGNCEIRSGYFVLAGRKSRPHRGNDQIRMTNDQDLWNADGVYRYANSIL